MILVGYQGYVTGPDNIPRSKVLTKSDLDDGKINLEEFEPMHILAEVYSDQNGIYSAFCSLNNDAISGLEELEMIYSDIKKDGINTWFFENGFFKWKEDNAIPNFVWDWEPSISPYNNPLKNDL